MRRTLFTVTLLIVSFAAYARGPGGQWETQSPVVPVAGSIVRLNAATGEGTEIFRLEHQSLTPPCVLNDTAYVGASDKAVYAVDAATGKTKWKYPTGHFVFFVRAGGKALFVGAGPMLYAIDPANGNVLWKYEADIAVNDLFLGEHVAVINTFDGPIALDRATGELRWKVDVRWGYFVFSPLAEGRLSIWKPDEIFVLETERGKTLWTTSADLRVSAPGAVPSPAVGTEKDIICQLRGSAKDAQDWSLYAIEGNSGKELWKQPLGPSETASPRTTILGDSLYCSLNDTIRKFRLASGQPLWRYNLDTLDPRCPIMRGGGAILIPQVGGGVLALDEETGKRLWLNEPAAVAGNNALTLAGVAPAKDAIYIVRNESGRQ